MYLYINFALSILHHHLRLTSLREFLTHRYEVCHRSGILNPVKHYTCICQIEPFELSKLFISKDSIFGYHPRDDISKNY